MQRLLPARAAAGPLTLEVLEGLDAFVHTERFLHKLDQARKELDEADADHATHLQQLAATGRTESLPVVEVQEDEFLDCTSATDRAASMPAVLESDPAAAAAAGPSISCPTRSSTTAAAAAAAEGYVVVDQQDAVEAMAYYIALYISAMPEAQRLEPKQLQAALKEGFKVVRRSKFKLVWDWGRWLYRWSAFSYGCISLYDNPWLVRALLGAIWTAAKATRFALGAVI